MNAPCKDEISPDFFAANPLVTVDEALPYRVTYRGKPVSL